MKACHIVKFICEKCLKSYETQDEALKCESRHCEPVSIARKSAKYVALDDSYDIFECQSYPLILLITMSDGIKIPYQIATPGISQREQMIPLENKTEPNLGVSDTRLKNILNQMEKEGYTFAEEVSE